MQDKRQNSQVCYYSFYLLLNNDDELKAWLDELFESKTKGFYREGIEKLVEHWGKVIDTNGEYIVD